MVSTELRKDSWEKSTSRTYEKYDRNLADVGQAFQRMAEKRPKIDLTGDRLKLRKSNTGAYYLGNPTCAARYFYRAVTVGRSLRVGVRIWCPFGVPCI